MAKSTTILAALWLVVSSVTANVNEIQHILQNGSQLLYTSGNNYAIASPQLSNTNNWASVSVNSDQVNIYSGQCQQETKSLNGLTNEQKSLLDSVKQQLGNQQTSGMNANFQNSRVQFNGNSIQTSATNTNGHYAFENIKIVDYENGRHLFVKDNLPNNIRAIATGADYTTFTYNDGRVLMKPTGCLDVNEQQIVKQLMSQYETCKRKFEESMRKYEQNMKNMQINMQQQLQQMQQKMQNNQWMQQDAQQQMFQGNNAFAPAMNNWQHQHQQQQQRMMNQGTRNRGNFGPNNNLLNQPGNWNNQQFEQQFDQNGPMQQQQWHANMGQQQQQMFGQQQWPNMGRQQSNYAQTNSNSNRMAGQMGGRGINFGNQWPFGPANNPFYPGMSF